MIILRKNIGIVILVGKAARFVTSDIVIAAIIQGQNAKLFPENMTKRIVIGVITQPCAVIITANQSRRFFSWLRHQTQNR